jgi:hypothetical protein
MLKAIVWQFEIDRVRVPILDDRVDLAVMLLCAKDLNQFEQRGIYAARVLNAPIGSACSSLPL